MADMDWSEAEMACRKHPSENPQPGICQCCLRERLSKIISDSSRDSIVSSTSPVYYYYSSGSSSRGGASPGPRRHQRVASDIMDSIYVAFRGHTSGLKKSRSIAYGPRNGVVMMMRDSAVNMKIKKKAGFWSRLLLRSTGNRTDHKTYL